jgi:hypothetical protein
MGQFRVDNSAKGTARHRDVAEYVREEPLTALAIAGVTGFVLGGGVNRRVGFGLLAIVGRIALRAVATSVIVGIITGEDGDGRPGNSRTNKRTGGGSNDNGRTDFQNPI